MKRSKTITMVKPEFSKAPKGVCTVCYGFFGGRAMCGFPCPDIMRNSDAVVIEAIHWNTLWSLRAACV